ncbi:hypothetical protein GVAV_000645 [Gurleya vavrai]
MKWKITLVYICFFLIFVYFNKVCLGEFQSNFQKNLFEKKKQTQDAIDIKNEEKVTDYQNNTELIYNNNKITNDLMLSQLNNIGNFFHTNTNDTIFEIINPNSSSDGNYYTEIPKTNENYSLNNMTQKTPEKEIFFIPDVKTLKNKIIKFVLFAQQSAVSKIYYSKPCLSTKLEVKELQLLNLGSSYNPSNHIVYLDDSQYKISRLNKRTNGNLLKNFCNLSYKDCKNLLNVLYQFEYLKNEIIEIKYLCHIQQIYVHNNMLLFVLKNKKTVVIGKILKTKDAIEFQTNISNDFYNLAKKCEIENHNSDFKEKCCLEKSLVLIIIENFSEVVDKYAISDGFKRCFKLGENHNLSELLNLKF